MKQEQVIAIYNQATFSIIDGEFKGKATKIDQIDFKKKEIVSISGKHFSFSSIKPLLKDIKGITLEEAQEIYRLYWNDPNRMYLDMEEIKNQGDENNPIYAVIRIWEGKDYVAGDRLEWGEVIEYCIDHSIDVFDLIKNNKAIKL